MSPHAHSRRPRSWTPSVPICLWGVALTVGPNYNMPMMAEPRAKVAYESLQHALQLLDKARPAGTGLDQGAASPLSTSTPLDPSNLDPVLRAYAAKCAPWLERSRETPTFRRCTRVVMNVTRGNSGRATAHRPGYADYRRHSRRVLAGIRRIPVQTTTTSMRWKPRRTLRKLSLLRDGWVE